MGLDEDGRGGGGAVPEAPPLRPLRSGGGWRVKGKGGVVAAAAELWDRLFREEYEADVSVRTVDGVVLAHASVLGTASPVMKGMLRRTRRKQAAAGGGGRAVISIRGVPHDAARAFIRFLYSSCYEQEDMNKYVLHLLVLSHVFAVPSLKQECVRQLEHGGLLSVDAAADVFQLAQLCDAPRLSLACRRFVLGHRDAVMATDGWEVMRSVRPELEKEILDGELDTRRRESAKKTEEKKTYLRLHAVMEALVHICRDGCGSIGPPDGRRSNQAPCELRGCRGVESLLRHFAGCKDRRRSGGCGHCRRMWQLLELHARLCGAAADGCKVPLCRSFKEKMRHQSEKDEMKWRRLVEKVMEAKDFSG